jgi:hypothetical protein
MNIANPIYDVIFKRLLSDMRIARIFIETLIGEIVTEVSVRPQELPYDLPGGADSRSTNVAIYRLDFVATIKTAPGEYKKILIEIQKTRKFIDLMRFRNYLGEHYKREDEVSTEAGVQKMALTIVPIYLLGFQLQHIESPAIKVSREYFDLVNHKIINKKDDFIEKLTHDCFVVQIPRIEGKLTGKLEKLLSFFEQKYFIDDTGEVKEYNYPIDDEDMKLIADVLQYASSDPELRRKMDAERESFRVFNLAVDEETNRLQAAIVEKDKALEEKDKALEEKNKTLGEKDKALEEKGKALEEERKVNEALAIELAELKRKLS